MSGLKWQTVMLLKCLMQEEGVLSQVKPNGEWEEVESEVLSTHQEANFKHFSLLQKQVGFCRTSDVLCERVWMWVTL